MILQQLEDRRQRAHRHRAAPALAHDARARRARRGGDRDDDFVGLGLVQDARQVAFGVPTHLHAVDAQAVLARVVVGEAHRPQAKLAVAQDLAQHEPPAVAGADDQDVALAATSRPEATERAALVQAAHDHPDPDQQQQREQEEQRHHPVRQPHGDRAAVMGDLHGPHHLDRHHRQQHDRDRGARHRLVVALPRIAPAALVDARGQQHHETAREHPPDGALEQLVVAPRGAVIEAQLEGQEVGERHERAVQRQPR